MNLLLVYYKTGYKGLDVSILCEVVLFICTACKNCLALCLPNLLSPSKDSAEEAGAGAGFGLEEHLEPTTTTFRQHGSFVTTLPPCGGPCIIVHSEWGFVCVSSHRCFHSDLQSTVQDQSHTVTPTATAAPLYSWCISANHSVVSSIPGGSHLTMHSLDFWFLIPLSSTSILNVMTSELAQSHWLWIQCWCSCDSAFLPLNHQFLVFTLNFHVINVFLVRNWLHL